MRSELGRITLDKTTEERNTLSYTMAKAINEAGTACGLKCLRYKINSLSQFDPHFNISTCSTFSLAAMGGAGSVAGAPAWHEFCVVAQWCM